MRPGTNTALRQSGGLFVTDILKPAAPRAKERHLLHLIANASGSMPVF